MKNASYHVLAGISHFVLSILNIIFAGIRGDNIWRVGYSRFNPNPEDSCASFQFSDTGSVSLRYVAFASLLITSVAHFCAVFRDDSDEEEEDPPTGVRRYKRRRNPHRWVEYAISSGVIIGIGLAILAGERNLFAFIQRAGCMSAMMLCCYLTEYFQTHIWLTYAWLFGFCVFIQDITLFSMSLNDPIIPVYYFFSLCLILLVWFELEVTKRKGRNPFTSNPWPYSYTEFSYLTLSLVSKTYFAISVALKT